MSNQSGIDDHSGEKAEPLAAGYKSINRQQVYPELYAFAQQASNGGKQLNILDIGSGSGNDAIEMAKLGHKVVAVEPSDLRHIAIRDHSHANIEYRDGSLPALDSVRQNEKFDLVMLSAVWQYVDPSDRVASLIKIADTLKPDGKLIVVYPSPPSREHQFEASPEMLKADIEAANKQLPKSKKLSISGDPVVLPDSRGRKSLDGRDLNFYTFTIETGHAQSLGPRDGWTPTP